MKANNGRITLRLDGRRRSASRFLLIWGLVIVITLPLALFVGMGWFLLAMFLFRAATTWRAYRYFRYGRFRYGVFLYMLRYGTLLACVILVIIKANFSIVSLF